MFLCKTVIYTRDTAVYGGVQSTQSQNLALACHIHHPRACLTIIFCSIFLLYIICVYFVNWFFMSMGATSEGSWYMECEISLCRLNSQFIFILFFYSIIFDNFIYVQDVLRSDPPSTLPRICMESQAQLHVLVTATLGHTKRQILRAHRPVSLAQRARLLFSKRPSLKDKRAESIIGRHLTP